MIFQLLTSVTGSFVLSALGGFAARKKRPLVESCRNDFCAQSTTPGRMRAGRRIPGIRRAAGRLGWTRPPTPGRRNPAGRQSTAPALTAGDIHVAAGKGRLCGRSVGSWRRSGRAAWMGRQRRARKRRLRCYRVLRTPPARAPSAFESQSRDWPDAAAGRPRRYVVDSA